MKTIFLLFMLHALSGLPGRIIFTDVIVGEPEYVPWIRAFSCGFFIILIIVNAVLWIRSIKRKAINKE